MKGRLLKIFNVSLNLIAIGFVVYLFGVTDWVDLVNSVNVALFIFAVVVGLVGFCFQAVNWSLLLHSVSSGVPFKESFQSVALTIFAKYIPGKIWMVLGRAAYIAQKYPISLGRLSRLSLLGQVLAIVLGVVLSLVLLKEHKILSPFLSIELLWVIVGISLVLVVCLGLWLRKYAVLIQSYLFACLSIVAMWSFWGIGFYVVSMSTGLQIELDSLLLSAVFIYSCLLGILAFIVPGGIGVREAGLVATLTLLGVSLADATAISVVARVWFTLSEVAFYSLGCLIGLVSRKS